MLTTSSTLSKVHHVLNPRMSQCLLGRIPPSLISPQKTLNKINGIVTFIGPSSTMKIQFPTLRRIVYLPIATSVEGRISR
mmetsp:Transcript_37813/g.64533  ORF Transcript_37813/g.64533 Transcript_37813/m.64533 type:complete len:80 (-) Transcript_37813:29-268(-)